MDLSKPSKEEKEIQKKLEEAEERRFEELKEEMQGKEVCQGFTLKLYRDKKKLKSGKIKKYFTFQAYKTKDGKKYFINLGRDLGKDFAKARRKIKKYLRDHPEAKIILWLMISPIILWLTGTL